MADMEYKCVPLPAAPRKYKGVKNPVDRTARTMTEILNEEARGGWHFVRAEQMEVEARSGLLRSKDEVDVTLLVFGRERPGASQTAPAVQSRRAEPQAAPRQPAAAAPVPAPDPYAPSADAPAPVDPGAPGTER